MAAAPTAASALVAMALPLAGGRPAAFIGGRGRRLGCPGSAAAPPSAPALEFDAVAAAAAPLQLQCCAGRRRAIGGGGAEGGEGGERTCSSGGVTSVFMALRMLCTRQESLESSRLGGRLIENPTPAPFLLAGLTLIFNEHQSSSPLYISDVIAVPQCMMDQRAFSEYLHFSLNPLNAAPVQSCRTDLQRLSAEP